MLINTYSIYIGEHVVISTDTEQVQIRTDVYPKSSFQTVNEYSRTHTDIAGNQIDTVIAVEAS